MTRLSRAGLIILGLLSLGDLAAPLVTDGEHPPMFIALIGAAIGAISIVLVILAWRGRTAAAIALVVVRLLSASPPCRLSSCRECRPFRWSWPEWRSP